MTSRPSRSARRAFVGLLRERRIYIRTDAGTHYFSLNSHTQVAGVLIVASLLAWSGFTSAEYIMRALDGGTPEARLEAIHEAYEARITALGNRQQTLEEDLARADRRRDAVTTRLSEKQSRLVETGARLREATTELAVLRQKVEMLTARKRADSARIASLESELAEREDALVRARIEKQNLETAFDRFSAGMKAVIDERDAASVEADELRQRVARLSGNLGGLKDRQQRLISRIEDAARTTFAGLKNLFARSDLDLDRILAEARRDYNGAGGPFRPLDEKTAAAVVEGDTRVAALMRELETVNLMRFAADRLPFGQPVTGARLTSAFGPRNDPAGRGHSMHEGIDLAGPRGTPIVATAGGIVTFSGRMRGYGIVVKIRHAFGFETVYAHLNRARVKVGHRVVRGDRIGDMGNTGRSTGTHVHYEIRIDNSPVNPRKFIEAARDVL